MGCISFKPNASKGSKKLYPSFFLGDKGNQYFIKPLAFENTAKEGLKIDFTFRDNSQGTDSIKATVNSSIILNELISNVDSLTISSKSYHQSILEHDILFKEREAEQFLIRISGQMAVKGIKQLFEETDWTVKVFSSNKEFIFHSIKKTNKSIPLLYSAIFELLS